MLDENTPDLITLEDDAGAEFTFEIVDEVDYADQRYIALVPYADTDEAAAAALEEEASLVIMRVGEENGEEYFDTVDDDEELYNVGNVFAQRLSELYDIDGDELPHS